MLPTSITGRLKELFRSKSKRRKHQNRRLASFSPGVEKVENRLLLTVPGDPGGGDDPFGGGGSDPGGGGDPSGGGPSGGGSTGGGGVFDNLDGLTLRPAGQQWFNNFGTEPLTGTTALARDLPGGLSLEYRSDTNGLPIVIGDSSWDHTSSPTGPIEAKLIIDGVEHSNVFLDATSITQGDELRVALRVTTELASGKYSTEIQFIADVGNGAETSSVTQDLIVENRTDSGFGEGWTLSGLERLISDTGGYVHFDGTGKTDWFDSMALDSSLTENTDGTFTLNHSSGNVSHFDSSGQITSRVSEIGNTITFGYNLSGDLTSVTDIYGRSTSFAWQNDLLESVTDWASQTLDIVHDTNGSLTSITSSYYNGTGPQLPAVTNYTYDSEGRVASVSESTYLLTTLAYDDGGRLSQAVLPGGHTWQFDSVITQAFVDPNGTIGTQTNPATIFDPANAKAIWTNPLSGVSEISVDENGFIVLQETPDGSETAFTRDSEGRVLTVTSEDPDGAGPLTAPVSTHTYNTDGKKTQTVYPGGATQSWAYDTQSGKLASVTDPLGNITTYTWNTNKTLASVTRPNGAVTSYTYDTYGNLLTTTLPDPDGVGPKVSAVITNTLDSYGRVTSTTVGGRTVSRTYDAANRLTSETDPLGNTTSYVWTALGRIESVTLPDPDGAGPLTAPVETYQWDWYGRLLSSTSPSGVVSQNAYDTSGRLASTTVLDPDGVGPLTDLVNSWTYDAMGQVLSSTDPLLNVTSQTYDSIGRLTSVTAPDPDATGPLLSPVTSFSYDALGRLTTQTDPAGGTIQFAYNNAGNRTAVTNALGDSTTSTFDAAGNVLTVTDALGRTTSFTYGNNGLVSQTTLPDPDGIGPLTAPSSTNIYDLLGQVTSVTGFDGSSESWDYDVLGQLTTYTAADGSTQSYTYDAAGQVLSTTGADPDGAGRNLPPSSATAMMDWGERLKPPCLTTQQKLWASTMTCRLRPSQMPQVKSQLSGMTNSVEESPPPTV